MTEYLDVIQNWWGVWGLVIDIIGFTLLMWDLIGIQSSLKETAQVKFNDIEHVKHLADNIDGIGEFNKQIARILQKQAEGELSAADRSVRYSYIGASLIILGFTLQIFGLIN